MVGRGSARGRLAGGGARGGEVIPASRSARARVVTGAGSIALAAGLGAWLAVVADEPILAKANATAGVAAAALLGMAVLLRLTAAVPVAVVLLGAAYAALLGHEVDPIDARAPLVAAALFAVAELAYWSTELRGAVADEPGTYLRRAALLAISLLGAIAVGTLLLAVVETVDARGIVVELVGAAAAVVALALVAVAARRGAT